ncbi:hypothetical protein Kisp01_66390 [Kineosporia sp. NBRC 101677]|nr:hypothetical protein Kisp01_66390 [Kineosporia sp. NBRC 101677]
MAFSGPDGPRGESPSTAGPVLADGRTGSPWASSEATRYLCVGAYLDRNFRRRVMSEVLGAEHRAVAPSYGIDIIPVLRHCLRAQTRERLRNIAFAVLFMVLLLINAPLTIMALATGYGWRLTFLTFGALARRQFLRAAGLLVLSVAVSGLVALVLVSLAALQYMVSTATGYSGELGSSFGGEVSGSAAGFVLLLWGSAWGIRFAEMVTNHRTILSELSPGRFVPDNAPQEPARHVHRLAFLAHAQTGNITYYARTVADRPFVGSGYLEEPWHLAVPLRRRSDAGDPVEELTVQTLYRRMRRALASLADETLPPGQRIVGLSMQPRLFVPGLLRPSDGLIDRQRGKPRHHLSRAELDEFEQHDRNRATEYLTVRIGAWEGELEVTIFVYFSIRGNTLYMEFVGASLPSVRELYHSADTQQQLQPSVYASLGFKALAGLPMLFLLAPVDFYHQSRDRIRAAMAVRREAQDISTRLAFDYGVRSSVRELGADYENDQFFQRLDGRRYIFLVERRVRDAVAEVLHEFGYSTEEFLERTQMIINNTTQINGGTFNNQGGAMAFGAFAQAMAEPGSGPVPYLPPRSGPPAAGAGS